MQSVMSAPFRGFKGTTKNAEFVFFMKDGKPFARAKTIPANPQTDDQVKIRVYLSSATKNWALLTDAQRAAWLAWGQTYLNNAPGDTTVGLDAYVATNSVRQILGLSLTSEAPTTAPPAPATGLTMATSSTDGQVDFWISHTIASGSVANYKILVRQTPIMRTAAQNPRPTLTRFIEHVSSDSSLTLAATGISHPYNFASPQFPPVAADRYGLSVQIVETATGLASGPFFASVVQSAT